jgi:hypothetical protein
VVSICAAASRGRSGRKRAARRKTLRHSGRVLTVRGLGFVRADLMRTDTLHLVVALSYASAPQEFALVPVQLCAITLVCHLSEI